MRAISILLTTLLLGLSPQSRASITPSNPPQPARSGEADILRASASRLSPAAQRHARLAVVAAKAEKHQQAVQEWTEVLRIARHFDEGYYYRGCSYEEAGNSHAAIADLTEFIHRQPQWAIAWARRGIDRADVGDLDGGLKDCDHAIEMDPTNAFAHALRADVHRLASRYPEALREADKAIKLDPDLPRAYQVKARAYEETRDYRSAIREFTRVMKLLPTWANPLVGRAMAYAMVGENRAALNDFRRAQRHFPDSARVHDGLAWFLATCPEGRYRDGKRAVSEASLACQATAWKFPEYVDTMAAALAEAGDFDQAIERQQLAIRLAAAYDRKTFENHLASYRQHKPWREKVYP